eukprot:m.643644 g.643644  ORF g.643644 m.643644 type:complete len:128 (+) comp58351_c0_seq23:237-620(+)
MKNLIDADNGAQIVLATSWDPSHPPDHILDKNPAKFWITTGMFPQEFVVSFGGATNITAIQTRTMNARNIKIQKSEHSKPTGWKDLSSADVSDCGSYNQVQVKEFQVPASFLFSCGHYVDHVVSLLL